MQLKVGIHNTDQLGCNLLSYKIKVPEYYRLILIRSTNHFLNVQNRIEPEFEPCLKPTQPDWTRFSTSSFVSKIGFNPKKSVVFSCTNIKAYFST